MYLNEDILINKRNLLNSMKCKTCNGKGYIEIEKTCETCNGIGKAKSFNPKITAELTEEQIKIKTRLLFLTQ